ncbi:MAG: hypothetical protein M3256_24150 [Actinomycetota bacterium]|nr:hypothetical protein [Actinomycetota bacterium]
MLLGGERFGVEVAARPHHGHEQLRLDRHRAGRFVPDRDALAGEVDEELLARLVLLPGA